MAKVGDKVNYVPDQTHWNDRAYSGQHSFCFELLYVGGKLDGQPVPKEFRDPRGMQMDASGTITNAQGHRFRIGKPLFNWDAEIVVLNPDGSADLVIKHPDPMFTHRYPAVPRSDKKVCHSWHEKEGDA